MDDHLPGLLPWGDRTTLRHLLAHPSGLVDDTDRIGWFIENLGDPFAPEDIVTTCAGDGPLFEPGTDVSHANTNDDVLALVLEAVTGGSFHAIVRTRMLDPLGLDATDVEGPEDLGGLVPGYTGWGSGGGRAAPLDPSWHWAAGGMVSDVADLSLWAEALLDGGALPAEARALQQARQPLADGTPTASGSGLRHTTTPCGPVLGHTGRTMGFPSDLLRTARGVRVVVLTNDFLAEASEIAWATCAEAHAWLDLNAEG